MLKGFGKACEQFTFESFDGFDANGCALFTGTVTFTLADAQQSSFTEREQDTACQPGNSPQERDITSRTVTPLALRGLGISSQAPAPGCSRAFARAQAM